ncbi:MAG: hypothetical protein V7K50_12795 [Nostoc sp.]|uniref:hypothetical protein n=1 Tax=Nostoc sp. TaxID=1180 RepID=UPI002FF4BC05
MDYPDNNQVSTNARLRYNSRVVPQPLPKNNQISEIERLNEESRQDEVLVDTKKYAMG